MAFVVPKFIEMEPKIVGPFTFKQFIYVALAGAVCFILYFSLAKKSFFLFILISIILMLGSLVLAFFQIGGQPLPTVLKNFFFFSGSSKLYIFKKKVLPPKIVFKKEEVKPKEKIEAEPVLKITKKGRLQRLFSRVATGTR